MPRSSLNRLTNASSAAGGVNLFYDPLGRLRQLSGGLVTDVHLQHDGIELAAEYRISSGLLSKRYVFGPGIDEPLVWYEGSGSTDRRFLHADERGSIVAVSDASGNVLAKNSYDEFGRPGASNLGRFQYTGQAWLQEIGVQYSKARMYDPALGRFLQTDPAGYAGGINQYAYVGNDPVNFTDPLGLKEDYDRPGPGDTIVITADCQATICPRGLAPALPNLEVFGDTSADHGNGSGDGAGQSGDLPECPDGEITTDEAESCRVTVTPVARVAQFDPYFGNPYGGLRRLMELLFPGVPTEMRPQSTPPQPTAQPQSDEDAMWFQICVTEQLGTNDLDRYQRDTQMVLEGRLQGMVSDMRTSMRTIGGVPLYEFSRAVAECNARSR